MSCSTDQTMVDLSCLLNNELANLSKTSNIPFIFRVRQSLRKENEEAYEPEMLSIGPYHHGKENLKEMEKYKLKYLHGILERQREESTQRYIAALRKVEKKARDCYAEHLDLSPQDFVRMMLLDGCFIIEFLRNQHSFSLGWYHSVLCRDLLLFENQLPFFILELLFDMTEIEGEHDLIRLSISSLKDSIKTELFYDIKKAENGVFHLLSLMHESWCSSFAKAVDTQREVGRQRCFTQWFKRLHSRRDQVENPRHMDTQEEGGHQRCFTQLFKRLQSRRDQAEDTQEEGGQQRYFIQFFNRLQSRRDQVEDPRHTDTQEEREQQRYFTQFFNRLQSRRDQVEDPRHTDTQEEGGQQRYFTQFFNRLQSRRDQVEDPRHTDTQEEGGQQRYFIQFFNRLQSRRDQVEDPRHTDTQEEGGQQRYFTQFFNRLQSRRDQVEDPRHTDTQEEGGHQRCFTQFFKRRHSRRDQAQGRMDFIKSVRELKQYGIEFREANQSGSWLDIKFENGIMQIPNLEVDDGTESLLRNLIAYEQYMPHLVGCRVVSDYTRVIDCLINSSEDVQWLCHNKIITNWLGSDEEISKMFNKSGNGVFLDSQRFSYSKLFKDVNEHCNSQCHAWIADLKKKYFHNPWSIISFLAAIFLLLLTLIQTVVTVIQVAN